ncbi:MAG: NYN domain-containing protein [Acidimicrobiales bacterium]
MASTHLVIDGSNIATEGRSLPSLQQLDEAVRAFLKERPHETWTVVVDATFGHRIDSSEKRMYEEALAANEMVTPPAGTIGRGDKFLLEIADRAHATVFSNDSFQEFHGEYEWLFEEGRLIGGKPVPEVGWIFTERTPVRGPRSRMASRTASERRGRLSSGSSRLSRRPLAPTAPLPVPRRPPPRAPRRRPISAALPEPAEAVPLSPLTDSKPAPNRRRSSAPPSPEPVNLPLPFIEFIAEHGPGSKVDGEVVSFTSHGAFIQVGDVRCYLALKSMGDPAPRSARGVLNRGEVRTFVVEALDAPRRGIDLALPEGVEAGVAGPVPDDVGDGVLSPASVVSGGEEQPEIGAAGVRRAARSAAASKRAAARAEAAMGEGDAGEPVPTPPVKRTGARTTAARRAAAAAGDVTGDGQPRSALPPDAASSEAVVPTTDLSVGAAVTRKAVTRTSAKTAAKKAPARTPAAKKAAAKKAAAKKAAAKKRTAPAETLPAKTEKAPAKTPATRKAATTKAPAKRAPAKRAPAKTTTAKKAAVKKAAVKKQKAPAKRAVSKAVATPDIADVTLAIKPEDEDQP